MAMIYVFIPDPSDNQRWRMGTSRNVELSRVPCVGECLSLGNDENDVHAVYQVVHVLHAAGRPNDTDAEVYLRRVDHMEVIKNLPSSVPHEIESDSFPQED